MTAIDDLIHVFWEKLTMRGRLFYFLLIVIHFSSQAEGAFFEQSAIKTARFVAKSSTFYRSINQSGEYIQTFSKRVLTTTKEISSSAPALQTLFAGSYQSDKKNIILVCIC